MLARVTAYCVAIALCSSVATAQRPVSSRQIREADSATTQPRIGDTVLIAGRVTLGGAALDTSRLQLYIEDTAGAAHIYGGHAQRRLRIRVGDSASVRGVIARYRNVMELGAAVVTVLPVPPRPPRPLPLTRLRDATHDTLQMRLFTVEATVAATELARGPQMIGLSDPSDSLDRRLYVVELPSGNVPLDRCVVLRAPAAAITNRIAILNAATSATRRPSESCSAPSARAAMGWTIRSDGTARKLWFSPIAFPSRAQTDQTRGAIAPQSHPS